MVGREEEVRTGACPSLVLAVHATAVTRSAALSARARRPPILGPENSTDLSQRLMPPLPA